MTEGTLLRIARIQQIDVALTSYGLTRVWIFKNVIWPNWFIQKRTYYNYLDVNAKKELRDRYGLDWEEELKKYVPLNYTSLIEEMGTKEFYDVRDVQLTAEQRAAIIKELRK